MLLLLSNSCGFDTFNSLFDLIVISLNLLQHKICFSSKRILTISRRLSCGEFLEFLYFIGSDCGVAGDGHDKPFCTKAITIWIISKMLRAIPIIDKSQFFKAISVVDKFFR